MSEKILKRDNYISWDEYFMGLALLSAQRSKDPSTQVGACIANKDNKVMGLGYNGLPRGCSDDDFPWEREGDDPTLTKYAYIVHAEANAILNSTSNLYGSRIYVALFPCNECAKQIIQSGIKEVVYISDKYADVNIFQIGRKLLETSGVKLRQFIPENKELIISMDIEKI